MALVRTAGRLPPGEPTDLSLRIARENILPAEQPRSSADRTGFSILFQRPVLAGALLALLGGILLVALPRWNKGDPTESGLVARGLKEGGDFAVRALCEVADAAGRTQIRSLSESPGPEDLETCPAEGRVLFAYLAERSGFLSVILEGAGQQPRVLLPTEREGQVPVSESRTLAPLPLSRSGGRTETLVFLFSKEPLSQSAVEATLREAGVPPNVEILKTRLEVWPLVVRLRQAAPRFEE